MRRTTAFSSAALVALVLGFVVGQGCGYPEYTYEEMDSLDGGRDADSAADVSTEASDADANDGSSHVDSADGANEADVADGANEADATDGASEADVTDGSSEADVTDGASEADVTDGSSEEDVTDGASEADVTDGASEADVTDGASEADVTDGASEADVTDGSSEADVTDGASEADVVQDSGPDCGGAVEQCFNGLDDDCDGKTDCEDPDCSPVGICTNNPPEGWSGIFAMYQGSPSGAGQVVCDADYSEAQDVLGRNVQFGQAICSSCSCGTPTGTRCLDPEVAVLSEADCMGNSGWTIDGSKLSGGGCVGYNLTSDSDSGPPPTPASVYFKQAEVDPNNPGVCTSGGGVAQLDSPKWESLAIACGTKIAGGGCSAGTCVPRPKSTFNAGLCIWKPGDNTCPAPYFNKSVYYESWLDTRGCSACTCGTPTGTTCHGTLTVSSHSGCSSPEVTMSSTGCSNDIAPQNDQYFRYTSQSPTLGSCSPSGGQPMGTVQPDSTKSYTVCCRSL